MHTRRVVTEAGSISLRVTNVLGAHLGSRPGTFGRPRPEPLGETAPCPDTSAERKSQTTFAPAANSSVGQPVMEALKSREHASDAARRKLESWSERPSGEPANWRDHPEVA